MKKTKIDWADSTWNPVTGCLHGCEYCYARRIAERFGVVYQEWNTEAGHEWDIFEGTGDNHVLEEPTLREWKNGSITKSPYPFCFDPTFHRYRLDEPQHWKKPRTIFVCSMADLFGDWVPDEWIQQVLEACKAAPQHRYLFLTKNPERYFELLSKKIFPSTKEVNWMLGYSLDGTQKDAYPRQLGKHSFISIEPLLKPLSPFWEQAIPYQAWVIIGAETGNRKDKVVPEKSWIDRIVVLAKKRAVPVFMKESLRALMGEDFRQEFPWPEVTP